MNLEKYIVNIDDFPVKGVRFKDITEILKTPTAFHYVIDELAAFAKEHRVEAVVAPDARGFWLAPALAYAANIPFIPVRKKGKLPQKTYEQTYSLEYGENTLSIHQNALTPGQRFLVCDDILATGGTIKATIELAQRCGATVVGAFFLGSITFLKGDKLFDALDIPWKSLLKF